MSWESLIRSELAKTYGQSLTAFLKSQVDSGKVINPHLSTTFKALDLTPLWSVKCVIVGQDPYPDSHKSTGVAFGAPYLTERKNWPTSLKNIERALKVDLGLKLRTPDLTNWGITGVLLLNRVLTMEAGKPLSHSKMGWERFTEAVMKTVIDSGRPVIWVLWGKDAQDGVLPLLHQTKAFDKGHEVIVAAHPSPQFAHQGFLWHKPFSKINQFCYDKGYSPIDWGDKEFNKSESKRSF